MSTVFVLMTVPVAVWIIRRRRRNRSVAAPIMAVLVLIAAAAVVYPFARLTVARPAALSPELAPEQARDLLQVLLKNVYRAFDFRDEEDVYDKLAISVRGELLADIYLQNRRSFAIQQAGGAQAKIKSIEIQEAVAERLDNRPLAYAIRGRWTAQGTVGHWGHVHMRRNRYEAIVTVAADNDAWKIVNLDMLEEQRIDPVLGVKSATASAKSDQQRPASQ